MRLTNRRRCDPEVKKLYGWLSFSLKGGGDDVQGWKSLGVRIGYEHSLESQHSSIIVSQVASPTFLRIHLFVIIIGEYHLLALYHCSP